MRRKGYNRSTMAVANDIESTLAVAVFAVALLLALVFLDEAAQAPPVAMPRCGEVGAICMDQLAYAPGERPATVSVAALTVRP